MKSIIDLRIGYCLILLQFSTFIFAQHADIEGHTSIRGNLDVGHMDDLTSIHIGHDAGKTVDFSAFRSNTFVGFQSGMTNTSGSANAFYGTKSGESATTSTENSFFGHHSGLACTSGSLNSFFGASAGENNIASNNCFFGAYTGYLNTSGKDNAFFGNNAGQSNTIGRNNSFYGKNCGLLNTSGSENTFYGSSSGNDNISGYHNAFFGESSGIKNTNGYRNTFIGSGAGQGNTTGVTNVFLGFRAGENNYTGSANTIIGPYADVSSAGLFNATALGFNAKASVSNMVKIGNQQVTLIKGQVPFTSSSDRRLKEDIQKLELGLEFMMDLEPVSYHRKANEMDDLELGLIAQDLRASLVKCTGKDLGMLQKAPDGYFYVRYNDLLAPMIKAVQELNIKIDNHILNQQQHLQKIEQQLRELKTYYQAFIAPGNTGVN